MELRKTEEAQLERLNLKEAVLSSDELLNHNYLIAKQKHNRCTNMCCNIREVIEDIKFCPNCGREIDKSLNLFFRDSRDEVMKFMEWHFYINQREEDRKENGHLIEEVEKSRFVDVSEFDEAKVLMYNPCLDEFVPVEPREALTGHEQALLDTCDNIINDLPPFSLVNVLETARLFLKEGTDIEIDSKGGVRPAVTANDQERGLIELAKDISAYTEFTPLHIMEDIKNIQQNLSLKPVNLNTLQAFKNATQAIAKAIQDVPNLLKNGVENFEPGGQFESVGFQWHTMLSENSNPILGYEKIVNFSDIRDQIRKLRMCIVTEDTRAKDIADKINVLSKEEITEMIKRYKQMRVRKALRMRNGITEEQEEILALVWEISTLEGRNAVESLTSLRDFLLSQKGREIISSRLMGNPHTSKNTTAENIVDFEKLGLYDREGLKQAIERYGKFRGQEIKHKILSILIDGPKTNPFFSWDLREYYLKLIEEVKPSTDL